MISFVYFDVGGVLIKEPTSSHDQWQQMKRSLGIKPGQDSEFESYWRSIESQLYLGANEAQILPGFIKRFNLNLPDDFSLLGFLVRIFQKNDSIWPVVQVAREKYKLGLFTNMFSKMLGRIIREGLVPSVGWDVIVDSSVEGVSKPDIGIYQVAQSKAGAAAGQILLVENKPENIEPAKELGWQVFCYDSEDMESESRRLLDVLQR